ncbi:hypothetical protein [Lichenifustis flavocetrariae]|uniref:p-hydroxybenzoic acid efflux pump subunit AaeA-like beta-barrel domain-containing protein n=1 Tax=Lichenifustis flavocetrariae TaxID=2949735 RepID=A0AA41YZW4_9HYPH|nr:hypothetical protein [Lichenifustis flavocetrariae]MCW6510305.1 hypothetical protein [Lichenifustis flavocetrariae]
MVMGTAFLKNRRHWAAVKPIFTWVLLARCIPVRIAMDERPDGLHLAAGMTATIHLVAQDERGKQFPSQLALLMALNIVGLTIVCEAET